jgi:hypothetical protein
MSLQREPLAFIAEHLQLKNRVLVPSPRPHAIL